MDDRTRTIALENERKERKQIHEAIDKLIKRVDHFEEILLRVEQMLDKKPTKYSRKTEE